ncbi:MAG: acetylxylan esterase [Bacteroidota bacterium]|nr:acetylxylan esterase [Bacteroidota bacterium]
MKRFISLWLICSCWLGALPAQIPVTNAMAAPYQNADSSFQRPLKEVLNDIASRFHVRLKVPDELVKGKMLRFADWRIEPWSVEQSLTNVLAPFDLKFAKEFEGVYKIKDFEYPRRTPDYGKHYLAYLSTLYTDRSSWETRKKQLKAELIDAVGLNPMPKPTGSKPIITNRRHYKDYSVENVALEILPGVYTFGCVYKPLKGTHCPIVINPTGHFADEHYRPDMQIRCAIMAKMGAIAVSYSLFAWGESQLQFKYEWHRQSIAHTIQTLNAIRWIDYLTSLKMADSTNVAITGGSSGGSQTMLITAIDDRIKYSAPVVMTSSWFAGGCPCESGLPIHLSGGGTNNAEIAAMCAPRPLLIVSDGKDWTSEVPVLEFPFIRRTFGFYGKSSLVENVHLPLEGHDYGPSKRQAVYAFLAKYLGLNTKSVLKSDGTFDESQVTIEPQTAMYVFGPKGDHFPVNAVRDLETLKNRLQEAKK